MLKPGAKGKRRSRRAVNAAVKQEVSEIPAEPVKKKRRASKRVKEEPAGSPEAPSGSLVSCLMGNLITRGYFIMLWIKL